MKISKKNIIAEIKQRRSWILACCLFPIMIVATIPFVSCMCAIGDAKARVLFVAEMCVFLRMLIGLLLAEKRWKAWFYFFSTCGTSNFDRLFIRDYGALNLMLWR